MEVSLRNMLLLNSASGAVWPCQWVEDGGRGCRSRRRGCDSFTLPSDCEKDGIVPSLLNAITWRRSDEAVGEDIGVGFPVKGCTILLTKVYRLAPK